MEPKEILKIKSDIYKDSTVLGRMNSGITKSNTYKKPDFGLPAITMGKPEELKQFYEYENLPKARPSIIMDFDFGVPPRIIIADDDYLNRLALRTLIKLCNVNALSLTFLSENGL